jgi:hypothetical protein
MPCIVAYGIVFTDFFYNNIHVRCADEKNCSIAVNVMLSRTSQTSAQRDRQTDRYQFKLSEVFEQIKLLTQSSLIRTMSTVDDSRGLIRDLTVFCEWFRILVSSSAENTESRS